jgi:hypothetical protein
MTIHKNTYASTPQRLDTGVTTGCGSDMTNNGYSVTVGRCAGVQEMTESEELWPTIILRRFKNSVS